MLGTDQLRIAVPSKGRLRDRSVEILRGAGLRFRLSGRRLFSVCSDTDTRIIFSNVQDIPVLVAEGVVDLGITGSDQILEKRVDVIEHQKLGLVNNCLRDCKSLTLAAREFPRKRVEMINQP